MKLAKKIFLTVLIIFMSSVFWLAVFPPATPRVVLNHYRAVQSIRSLNLAERTYAARHPEAGFACNLRDLSYAELIDRVLASGTESAYYFEIRCLQQGNRKAAIETLGNGATNYA